MGLHGGFVPPAASVFEARAPRYRIEVAQWLRAAGSFSLLVPEPRSRVHGGFVPTAFAASLFPSQAMAGRQSPPDTSNTRLVLEKDKIDHAYTA